MYQQVLNAVNYDFPHRTVEETEYRGQTTSGWNWAQPSLHSWQYHLISAELPPGVERNAHLAQSHFLPIPVGRDFSLVLRVGKEHTDLNWCPNWVLAQHVWKVPIRLPVRGTFQESRSVWRAHWTSLDTSSSTLTWNVRKKRAVVG